MKCPLCNNEITDVFNICDCGCQPDYMIEEVNMELQEVIQLAENGEETLFTLMGSYLQQGGRRHTEF